MKYLNNILTGLLFIAVVVLYYLHFKCDKHSPLTQNNSSKPVIAGAIRIAYFEMDSLQNHFQYYLQTTKELSASEQQKRNEFAARKNALYNKAKEYQDKGASMSQAELQKAQQDMAQRENEYKAFESSKGQELQDENFKKLQDVKMKIEDYLKEYSKEKGYSFVFANNSLQSEMFYKDTIYNITDEVIQGLNKRYPVKK